MRAIVIRHAERPRFASEAGGRGHEADEDDAPITEAGRVAATERGAILPREVGRVFTSPVRRCVETADSLAWGAGLPSGSVRVEDFLSSHFFGLLPQVDEVAKQEAVRMLLTGQPVVGFNDPRERCREACRRMAEVVADGSVVCVTHDWWMALLLANSTPAFERHGYAIWPGFLEAFEIDFRSDIIGYRGEAYPIKTREADIPEGER